MGFDGAGNRPVSNKMPERAARPGIAISFPAIDG
jgi:hypothetical protein